MSDVLAEMGETDIGCQDASRLMANRVAFASRGKRLHQRRSDLTQRLGIISSAILKGQCLTGHYNLRTRELHPYGIVVREPKIYLLAAETVRSQASNDERPSPIIKQYLINRFDSLQLNSRSSNVPVDFNVREYIDAGFMDVFVPELLRTLDQQFELVLKVREKGNDALVRDLQDFALASQQQALIKADDDDNYLLTVPDQAPTHALVEW